MVCAPERVVRWGLRNGRFSRRRRICSPTSEHRRLAQYICWQTNTHQWRKGKKRLLRQSALVQGESVTSSHLRQEMADFHQRNWILSWTALMWSGLMDLCWKILNWKCESLKVWGRPAAELIAIWPWLVENFKLFSRWQVWPVAALSQIAIKGKS